MCAIPHGDGSLLSGESDKAFIFSQGRAFVMILHILLEVELLETCLPRTPFLFSIIVLFLGELCGIRWGVDGLQRPFGITIADLVCAILFASFFLGSV